MASSATVNSRIGVGSGGVKAALHALFLLVISTLLSAGTARAELLAVDKRGFLSEHVIEMPASSTRVWEALTAEIDRWWDATHSCGGKASAFSLDAKAGGCFCEMLDDGGSIEHMRVVQARPGVSLVMQGGLGPLQFMGVAGSMSFTLSGEGETTELRYRYEVGGFSVQGLDVIAPAIDTVQLGQLRGLQVYLAGISEDE